ncbi:MAG: ATP-binding protein, partial [Planctomycetota bacterium]
MKSKKAKNVSRSSSSVGKEAGQAGIQKEATEQFESRFIANMAFQIRTLSHAIIGFCELLRYEKLTDSQTDYVNEICRAGQSVVSLVDNVLELSKIECGQLNVDEIICSFSELFEKIDSLVRPCAEAKGLEFEIFQCTDLPVNICTDPVRLCQCVTSLASNAVKFTDKGYVHLKISLEDHEGKSFIRFDVVDSGVGIPIDKQRVIFEPFTQIKDANECEFTSPGLGLTITSYLVKILGGKISVTSKPGEGSVFSLIIPAGVDVASEPLLERREPLVAAHEESDARYRRQFVGHVLLAEDQPSNRTVMSLLLEAMGMRVSVAEDGVQAVDKAVAESFDLILMDIKMPKMNGYEARKRLKKEGVT